MVNVYGVSSDSVREIRKEVFREFVHETTPLLHFDCVLNFVLAIKQIAS